MLVIVIIFIIVLKFCEFKNALLVMTMLSAEFFDRSYNEDHPGKSRDVNSKMAKVKNDDAADRDDNKNTIPNSYSPEIPRNIKRTSSPFHCGSTSASPVLSGYVNADINADEHTNYSSMSFSEDKSPATSNSAEKNREGLTDLATIVSKAYRHECSNDNSPVASKNHVNNRNNDSRRSRTRTEQLGKKRSSYSHVANEMSTNPEWLHQSFHNSVTLSQEIVNTSFKDTISPSNLDHRFETSNYFQSSTDSPKGVDDITGEELLLMQPQKKSNAIKCSIQGQIQLKDLYDEEMRKNRDLRNIVTRLEAEVSTLKISLAHVYDNPKKYDNKQWHSSIDKMHMLDDKAQNAKTSSVRVDKSNSHPTHKASKNIGSDKGLCQTKIQLEESKQVIQILFEDLKISRQNESILRNKLKSTRLKLQENQSRYDENMRIAMKSADDVRASLKELEQERSQRKESQASEVLRVKMELDKAKDECIRLKQLSEQSQTLATGQKDDVNKADVQSGQSAESDIDAEVENIDYENSDYQHHDEGVRFGTTSANEEEFTFKPEFQNRDESLNLPLATQLPIDMSPVIKRSVKTAQAQSNFVRNSFSAEDKTEELQISERLSQNNAGTSHLTSEVLSPITKKNGDSIVSKRILKFSSCIEDSTSTDDLLDTQPLTTSKSSYPAFVRCSNNSTKATLQKLMNELEVSKKRLHTADKKLNQLVNEKCLFSIVRKPNKLGVSGSFDVVNSLDDSIEVSHRDFAYV